MSYVVFKTGIGSFNFFSKMTQPLQVTRWPPEILAGKPRRDKNPAGIELFCQRSFEMSAGMPRQDINWEGFEDLFSFFFLLFRIRYQKSVGNIRCEIFERGMPRCEKSFSGEQLSESVGGGVQFFSISEFQMAIKWPKMLQMSWFKNQNVANFIVRRFGSGLNWKFTTKKPLWLHLWDTVFAGTYFF